MTFVIYVFWWNKALNVNWPVRVFRKSEPEAMEFQTSSNARELSIANGLKTIFFFIIGFRDDDVVLSHKDSMPRFGPGEAAA